MVSNAAKQLSTGTFIGIALVTPLMVNVNGLDSFADWKPLTPYVDTQSVTQNYSQSADTPPEEILSRSFKTTKTLSVQIHTRGKQKAYPLEEYNHLKEA